MARLGGNGKVYVSTCHWAGVSGYKMRIQEVLWIKPVVIKINLCAYMFVFQAEVWDLDIIRTNNSSWPVEVPDIKEGFIVVKGHSTVQTCFVWFSLGYSVSGAAVLRRVGCKKNQL